MFKDQNGANKNIRDMCKGTMPKFPTEEQTPYAHSKTRLTKIG